MKEKNLSYGKAFSSIGLCISRGLPGVYIMCHYGCAAHTPSGTCPIITLCKAAELQTPGASSTFYRIGLLGTAVEQAAAAMGSSAEPSCSNALPAQATSIKARGRQFPCSAIEQAFIPVASVVSSRALDRLPSKQVLFFCSLVVRPEPWRRPIIKQKRAPIEGAR